MAFNPSADSSFGGLGLGGDFIPTNFSRSPFDTGLGSTKSSSTSSGNGFLSGLGTALGTALNTGAGFLSNLATIDLFKRAQGAGIQTGVGATNTGGQQTTNATGSTEATSGMGLPSWAIPAGIGVLALLLIILMLRG